jgi:hypothetical protein
VSRATRWRPTRFLVGEERYRFAANRTVGGSGCGSDECAELAKGSKVGRVFVQNVFVSATKTVLTLPLLSRPGRLQRERLFSSPGARLLAGTNHRLVMREVLGCCYGRLPLLYLRGRPLSCEAHAEKHARRRKCICGWSTRPLWVSVATSVGCYGCGFRTRGGSRARKQLVTACRYWAPAASTQVVTRQQ